MQRISSVVAAVVSLFVLAAPALLAARTLPQEVSFEEFSAFMEKAFGAAVEEVNRPLGGYGAVVLGIDIAWIEDPMAGRTGAELLNESFGDYPDACEKGSMVLSAAVRQPLDGVTLLRQSCGCVIPGQGDQYAEAVIVEDGSRFQAFHISGGEEQRDATRRIADTIVAALLAAYR